MILGCARAGRVPSTVGLSRVFVTTAVPRLGGWAQAWVVGSDRWGIGWSYKVWELWEWKSTIRTKKYGKKQHVIAAVNQPRVNINQKLFAFLFLCSWFLFNNLPTGSQSKMLLGCVIESKKWVVYKCSPRWRQAMELKKSAASYGGNVFLGARWMWRSTVFTTSMPKGVVTQLRNGLLYVVKPPVISAELVPAILGKFPSVSRLSLWNVRQLH